MLDVFLVRDHQLFELSLRGRLVGPSAAESVAEAIHHLPPGSDVVVDLMGVDAIDELGVMALRAAILERRDAGVHLVLACENLDARKALVLADLDHVLPLAMSLADARHAVGNLLVA
jgi:anti-anti-sigma regulatory factor